MPEPDLWVNSHALGAIGPGLERLSEFAQLMPEDARAALAGVGDGEEAWGGGSNYLAYSRNRNMLFEGLEGMAGVLAVVAQGILDMSTTFGRAEDGNIDSLRGLNANPGEGPGTGGGGHGRS